LNSINENKIEGIEAIIKIKYRSNAMDNIDVIAGPTTTAKAIKVKKEPIIPLLLFLGVRIDTDAVATGPKEAIANACRTLAIYINPRL
jgi:hypothetical protein